MLASYPVKMFVSKTGLHECSIFTLSKCGLSLMLAKNEKGIGSLNNLKKADHTLEMPGLGILIEYCFMNHNDKIRYVDNYTFEDTG